MKKNLIKIGIASNIIGGLAIWFAKNGMKISADSLSVENAGLTVMKYIFIVGMLLIVIGIAMIGVFFSGEKR